MLSLDQTNRVTFTVNVFGTAATPSVRVLIGETPALAFSALKLAGNEYEALIDLPDTIKPGAHQLKIEVLINGKLFTPIQTAITVEGAAPDVPVAEPAIEPAVEPEFTVVVPVQAAPEPAPAPAPEAPRLDAVMGVTQPVAETPAPKVEAPKPAPKRIDVTSLMRELNKPVAEAKGSVEVRISAAPKLSALEGEAKKKRVPKVRKVVEQSSAAAPASLSATMVEVAAAADKRAAASPATAQVPTPTKIVEMNTEIPVSFVRGDVIYQ